MRHLVLVGLMGTGKSTVGRIVADRVDRALIDTDELIEGQTGSSVRELWEAGGEAAYRSLESTLVLDALRRKDPVVIAAPAGVILDPTVCAALRDAFVVWLRADPATLATRVGADDHRPLLGDDPQRVLTAMATDRDDKYRGVADAVVDAESNPAEIADEVVDLLERSVRRT